MGRECRSMAVPEHGGLIEKDGGHPRPPSFSIRRRFAGRAHGKFIGK